MSAMIEIENWQQLIVDEAMSWVGTPFNYGCFEKEKGTDCARFLLQTFKKSGYMRPGQELVHLPPDWFLAQEEEARRFEKTFVDQLFDLAFDVPIKERRVTDIILMEYNGTNGRYRSHLGMITMLKPSERMIHARNGKRVQVQGFSNFMSRVTNVLRLNGLPE